MNAQPKKATCSPQTWSSTLKPIDLREINTAAIIGRVPSGEARIRLITRSGFEQTNIFTSQIASM